MLAAAEKRGADAEREACARVVCEMCAAGDEPIVDGRAPRLAWMRAERARSASRADVENELHRPQHLRTCLLCRAGSEDLCRDLGQACALDRLRDHRNECGAGCRRKPPRPCREASRQLAAIRAAACRLWRAHEAAQGSLDYPDEYFHVTRSGETLRCAATAIRLRGPRNLKNPQTPPCAP